MRMSAFIVASVFRKDYHVQTQHKVVPAPVDLPALHKWEAQDRLQGVSQLSLLQTCLVVG